MRAELNKLDEAYRGREMRKLGAAPDYIHGSTQAVTGAGEIVVGSGWAASSAPACTRSAASPSCRSVWAFD